MFREPSPRGNATVEPGAGHCLRSLAALSVVLALAGCGRGESESIAAAKAQLARYDPAAATIELKNALEKNPRSAEARFLLGRVLLESGSAAAAEVELQRAIELGYPAARAVPLLARSMLAQGNAARVTAAYASMEWPDAEASAELKTVVATAWMAQGSHDDAIAALDAALRIVPTYEPAILLEARLAARGGDLDGALAQVDALLARHPQNADAWTLEGDLLFARSKEPAPAIEAYRKAVQASPQNVGAHAALISLHLAGHDLDAASRQLDALKAVSPKSVGTVMLSGQVALAKGDLQRAREQFQLVLRAVPDHVAALTDAGRTELGLNALEQAETYLSKAVRLAPGTPAPRLLLAQTYVRQNQPAKAQTLLAPLLERPAVPNEVVLQAAQASLLAGDAAKAEALLQRAANAAPDDPTLRTALALAHTGQGATDRGLAELQAISASDNGVSADLAMISTLMRQGKSDAALKAIATLAKKQPDEPLADQLRGQLLVRAGDRAGARASYESALAKDRAYFPAVAALGELDVAERRPESARARYGEFLAKSPGHLHAMMALADIAARTSAPRSDVAALIEAAIKAHPDALAPRLSLIDYQLRGDDPKAALAATQAGLAAKPGQPELIERLGRCQLALKDWEQARIAYRRLVSLQPKMPIGYVGLADVAKAQGDTAGAAHEAGRAFEVAPDAAPVQRLAIETALRDKRPELAMSYATKVQARTPDAAVGHIYEGEIAFAQQQWPAAEAAFRKALGKPGGAAAPERLHATLRAAFRNADAEEFAAGWRREHPDDTLFLFYLGDVATTRGDQEAAEQWYRAVVQKDPDHAIALNNVAWLMLQQKKPGALAMAEKAARAAPAEPQVLDTLAQAQAAAGQIANAVETARAALAQAPKDPSLRLSYAKYLIAAGNRRQAREELDRLSSLGKDFKQQDEVAALLAKLGPG